MADFALWATACETAFCPEGTFWSAYCDNSDKSVDSVLDADPVAAAVRALLVQQTEWTGTASELLDVLGQLSGDRVAKSKAWPDNPRALAGRLRRAATFLRKIGIEITFDRKGRARTRIIHLTATATPYAPEKEGALPSAPSASSASPPKASQANGLAASGSRTVTEDADGSTDGDASTVRANSLKTNGADDADDADANYPTQSAPEKTGWRARI